MGTGYTRQSSAEIIDGQVINALDFNNEFDALVAAFHATNGHSHDGTTGEGPTLVLGTATSGRLPGSQGGTNTAAADPAATDDTPDYLVGSTWINTTDDTLFVNLDNTSTAAIWQRVLTGRNRVTTTAPGVGDDIADFHQPGSIWVNTTPTIPQPYLNQSNSLGAAVWVPVMNGRTVSSTSAPGTGDDGTTGIQVGSIWTRTSTSTVYTNLTNGTGTATWRLVANAETEALAGLSTTGLVARTASATYVPRTLAGTTNQVDVTNGDGVSGAPTISLPNAITAPGSLTTTTTLVAGTSVSAGTTVSDVDGNVRAAQRSGSAKTANYDLTTSDVGNVIEVGSGGSITIPNSTFSTGDIITLFNNTTGNITITNTITTAYIAGTNADAATFTLATRGLCTLWFASGTVVVGSGNIS